MIDRIYVDDHSTLLKSKNVSCFDLDLFSGFSGGLGPSFGHFGIVNSTNHIFLGHA